MSGPGALSYAEIDAWARLTDTHIEPWEVEAIKAMDRAFLAAVAKMASKQR
jgi:hypothetical protein